MELHDDVYTPYEGRVINFAAGPSALPLPVLQQVQKELLNWQNTGVSVLEIGHRSADFGRIITEAEQDLRKLLSIPDNYCVLFMQGGGTGQFAAVPLNLLNDFTQQADYLVTGGWSKKAAQEAQKFSKVNVLFDGSDSKFTQYSDSISTHPDSQYLYFCSNETIHGFEFSHLPVDNLKSDQVLVADMSSNFLSRKINVSDYGVIFAGAQKNAGIAGLVIAIVRKDLLDKSGNHVPTSLSYKATHEGKSVLNTPPTFAIYISGLVFKWLLEQGGIEAIEKLNIEKSSLLYDYIDSSNGFYVNNVNPKFRSRMNVPITIMGGNAELEKLFSKEAAEEGITSTAGHASVGGLRISLYNATPLLHVKVLIKFMKKFHDKYKP